MHAVTSDLLDPGNIFAHLSYIFLITSMLMTSLRNLRVLALLSGLAAMAHFTFRTQDNASFVWELLFVLANGIQLALLLYRSRRRPMRDEEARLLQQVLEVEEPAQQRRLLDLLEWQDVGEGAVLMRQGDRRPPLIYIARGAAAIRHDGAIVGVCGEGDFLGDMSMVSGEPASATVEVTNPMRIARFEHAGLAQLLNGIPELSKAFDAALSRGLASKVLRMNKTVAGA